LDFVAPFPCPFNYGSVPAYIGQDGDLLDAVVLGPRRPSGTRIKIHALGAVRMIDRGTYDDKLICSRYPISPWKKRFILLFFMIYARSKSLINFMRGHKGRNSCEGWLKPEDALAKTTPRTHIVRDGLKTHH
jgi:inorganic pyrophosphatase